MSDSSTQVTDLLKITSRLISVLEREIEMLRSMKPVEMQNLQQDKLVLAAAYESAVEALSGDAAMLEAVAPVVRDELRTVMARFQTVLGANERALRAARDATDRVLRHIVDEVERQRGTNSGYSASGSAASLSGYTPRQGVAVTVDQRL
jgi:hypothetical protein